MHDAQRRQIDVVIGCNLAVEKIKAEWWLVVDDPGRIRDESRKARYLAIDQKLPLIAPMTSRGWNRPFYAFRPVDPFSTSDLRMGTKRADAPQDPPDLPCFAGVPFAAACAAFVMGAKQVILAGVDYHGTVHDRPEQLQRITESFVLLRRWCRENRRELVQGSRDSLLQFV